MNIFGFYICLLWFLPVWQKSLWKLCCTGSSNLLRCGQADVPQLWEVKFIIKKNRIHSWLQQSQAERTPVFKFRRKAERSKKFFIDLQAKEHITTMVNPKPCGHLCCCIIKGCEQVGDASQSSYTTLDVKVKTWIKYSSAIQQTAFHFFSNGINGKPIHLNNLWDEKTNVSI